MQLLLKEVTRENWQEVAQMRVVNGQAAYLSTNLHALAESRFYPDWAPLAVYDGPVPIGFVICSFDAEKGQAWIHRIMIDARHQDKGYTRATMKIVIRRLRQIAGCTSIGADYKPGNRGLDQFFESFKFRKTGEQTPAGNIIVARAVNTTLRPDQLGAEEAELAEEAEGSSVLTPVQTADDSAG